MPRIIDRRRSPIKTSVRADRSRRYKIYRLGEWLDPFPNILGTRPEKIVYSVFTQLGIPFAYQNWFNANLPEYGFQEWFRPDFIIPSGKIIVEVQGYYWHSKPDQIESDAFKYAIYETMGYKVITWWDFDIETRIWDLITNESALRPYFNKGGRVFTGNEAEINDSLGVASGNAKRKITNVRRTKYKRTVGTKKSKAVYSYGVL